MKLVALTSIAKMRELRARAQQLGDAAEQRYHAALVAEFHPRTDEQRKILFEHGRAEVLHRDRTLCWLYLKDGVREVLCWNRAGQLADHTRVDETAVEFNRVGYLAAMFASATATPPTARSGAGTPSSLAAGSCSAGASPATA